MGTSTPGGLGRTVTVDVNWDDPARAPLGWLLELPTETAGEPSLWWGLTAPEIRPLIGRILVWHWCSRIVWLTNPEVRPEFVAPRWSPAGLGDHQLVSTDPLSLEPDVDLPDCCGLHGFIRAGRWSAA